MCGRGRAVVGHFVSERERGGREVGDGRERWDRGEISMNLRRGKKRGQMMNRNVQRIESLKWCLLGIYSHIISPLISFVVHSCMTVEVDHLPSSPPDHEFCSFIKASKPWIPVNHASSNGFILFHPLPNLR